MLSLMMYGTRVSLIVGFSAALVAMLIGGTVGIARRLLRRPHRHAADAHHRLLPRDPRRPADDRRGRVWGRSLRNIILIIGVDLLDDAPRGSCARRSRASASAATSGARASLGASNTRLIMRHVLPQVAPLLVATAVLMVAYAIFAETAIAFLGLGDPSVTSWGLLIENAFARDADHASARGGRSCRPASRSRSSSSA